jgi:phage terminase, large subunit, PBSX family
MTYQTTVRLSEQIIPAYHKAFNSKKYTHEIDTSGRAGTKSSKGAIKAIYTIMCDEDASVVCMRKNHNKLRKTVYKETLRAINRLGVNKSEFDITVSPMQIRYKKNGNTIYFTGNDSIDDTKGIIDENKPIKLVQIDELTEFFDKGEGKDELSNIEATFIRGNDDWFKMEYYFNPPRNPKAPVMQWLDEMKQRDDVIHIHTDYRDVPIEWVGRKLIESAELMKQYDPKMYDWVWLGLCTGLEDVIYYMFKEDTHVQEPTIQQLARLKYIGIGIDYGQMNATTFEAFGIDFVDKCVRGIDEYYHSGRNTGKQKSPSEYAKDFKEFVIQIEKVTSQKVLYAVIDPSARGLAEEIKRVCPLIKIISADNTVMLGINRVQKLLSFQRLFYSPKQKHLIAEKYLYSWDIKSIEKGQEKPIKENDHCMDTERYWVMNSWKYIKSMLPFLVEKGEEE